MPTYEVLDTFPAFRRFWGSARGLPIRRQLDGWRDDYLQPWPELAKKQIANYADEGIDWRRIARDRVFPTLDERLPTMERVRDQLRRAIPVAVRRCREKLGMSFPVTFVIHVGIGCGAGWATTFRGNSAVLFGVENAAEHEWSDRETAVALVEHELAHLVHDDWRRRARADARGSPTGLWWQLYEEGFATRCEFLLGTIGLHHSTRRGRDWVGWCRENRGRLAARLLRAAQSKRSLRRFFGSWYDVDGYTETGYFLGSEVIRDWESRFTLRQIAGWNAREIRSRGRASLRRFAQESGAVGPAKT